MPIKHFPLIIKKSISNFQHAILIQSKQNRFLLLFTLFYYILRDICLVSYPFLVSMTITFNLALPKLFIIWVLTLFSAYFITFRICFLLSSGLLYLVYVTDCIRLALPRFLLPVQTMHSFPTFLIFSSFLVYKLIMINYFRNVFYKNKTKELFSVTYSEKCIFVSSQSDFW